MPELPEVECLSQAIKPLVEGSVLSKVVFHRKDLRFPIPVEAFKNITVGQEIRRVFRRSKYILMQTNRGFAVFHLGMTGNILSGSSMRSNINHTHASFCFKRPGETPIYLHFVDPRRFGVIAGINGERFESNDMFIHLGPEPLQHRQLGAYLFERSRERRQPIKTFIMDARHVVGVGNIYASESLFRSAIHPERTAGSLTLDEFNCLASAIKQTLRLAIKAGGTTFRDFKNSDGNPGYFAVSLQVYGRDGEACVLCHQPINQIRQTGRTTFFCPTCQK